VLASGALGHALLTALANTFSSLHEEGDEDPPLVVA
jgi:hypothetical protein